MRFADLAVNAPLFNTLTYRVPEELQGRLKSGARVVVPLRGRKTPAFVTRLHDEEPSFATENILFEDELCPPLSDEYLRFIKWLSEFYFFPFGEALFLAAPAAYRKGQPIPRIEPEVIGFQLESGADSYFGERKRSAGQQKIYQWLKANPEADKKQFAQQHLSSSSLRTLLKAGIVKRIEHAIATAEEAPSRPAVRLREPELTLTKEQRQCLDGILCPPKTTSAGVHVVNGVTGSGKTEIFLQLCARLLIEDAPVQSAAQILVLIPEINLSFQTIERFEARFHARIAVLHSEISDKQRLLRWQAIQAGEVDIVIGTRLAALCPFKKLAAIIVDEEHDGSYEQDNSLRYNARDVAVFRSRSAGAKVVLASATPRLGSFFYSQEPSKALDNSSTAPRYIAHRLTRRAGDARLPSVEMQDVRGKVLYGGLSDDSLDAIKRNLAQGGQSLVFLNRRGFAETLICQTCGFQAECPSCDSRLTIHLQPASLQCHHCGHRRPLPRQCPSCRSHQIEALGLGTEQVEAALLQALPNEDIIRVDSDVMRNHAILKQSLNKIHSGRSMVVIATQMLAKGHHFKNLNHAVVLGCDQGLLSPNPSILENSLQTLFQLSGRVGRLSSLPGRVQIQSIDVDNSWYQLVKQGDYTDTAERLLRQNIEQGLPPHTRRVSFYSRARAAKLCIEALNAFHMVVAESVKATNSAPFGRLSSELVCSPVVPSYITRTGNDFFYEQNYSSVDKRGCHRLLRSAFETFKTNRLAKRIFSIRVE